VRLLQRTAVGVKTTTHTKLGPKFYGPFQVVQRVRSVSYKLQLPAKARIHDVFHVALLKKFEGTPPDKVVSLPPILHGRILPVPKKVVKARLNRGVWEVLVHWLGCSATDPSWEQLEEFKIRYSEVQLADELFVGEEGNVIDAFLGRKYFRRKRHTAKGRAPKVARKQPHEDK
jgi:hypothetical protein